MDLLNQLMQQIAMPNQKRYEDGSIGTPKKAPARGNVRFEDGSVGMQQPGPQRQQQFKMYEDQSFQGDPRQFIQQNPGYKFYEDGSFAPPQARQQPPQQDPLAQLRQLLGF